jgi:hypothetical protein
MTREEVRQRIVRDPIRLQEIDRKIVESVRGLVAVLKDAGRPESAKELDALFFERDALVQEIGEFMRNNVSAIVDLMKGSR